MSGAASTPASASTTSSSATTRAPTRETADPDWAERRKHHLRLAEKFIAAVETRTARCNRSAQHRDGVPPATPTASANCRTWAISASPWAAWCHSKTTRHPGLPPDHRRSPRARRPNCTCSASPASTRWTSSPHYGVTSFDSTSAFRQAFMDDREQLPHRSERAYVAIRVPQVDGNPTLKRAILAGNVSQRKPSQPNASASRRLRALRRGRQGVDRRPRRAGRTTKSSARARRPTSTQYDGHSRPPPGALRVLASATSTASRSPSSAAPSATSAEASTTCRSSPTKMQQHSQRPTRRHT